MPCPGIGCILTKFLLKAENAFKACFVTLIFSANVMYSFVISVSVKLDNGLKFQFRVDAFGFLYLCKATDTMFPQSTFFFFF